MRTKADIEAYLMRSGAVYDEVESDPAMWVIRDAATRENIIARLAGPILLFRVKVCLVAEIGQREAFFERILTLNATEMLHTAYGISEGAVLLTAGLPMENLDYSEFQGILDELSLALSNHYESLRGFVRAA